MKKRMHVGCFVRAPDGLDFPEQELMQSHAHSERNVRTRIASSEIKLTLKSLYEDSDETLMFGCPIWENICSMLSGDDLMKLAQVVSETKATPAFQMLTGLDTNCTLVPWNDTTNIMSSNYVHPHKSFYDEQPILIGMIAYHMLVNLHFPTYHDHWRGGPERPSSPLLGLSVATDAAVSVHDILYDYSLHGLFNEDKLLPVTFGLRAGFSSPPYWDLL
jgi:hypothetical protein